MRRLDAPNQLAITGPIPHVLPPPIGVLGVKHLVLKVLRQRFQRRAAPRIPLRLHRPHAVVELVGGAVPVHDLLGDLTGARLVLVGRQLLLIRIGDRFLIGLAVPNVRVPRRAHQLLGHAAGQIVAERADDVVAVFPLEDQALLPTAKGSEHRLVGGAIVIEGLHHAAEAIVRIGRDMSGRIGEGSQSPLRVIRVAGRGAGTTGGGRRFHFGGEQPGAGVVIVFRHVQIRLRRVEQGIFFLGHLAACVVLNFPDAILGLWHVSPTDPQNAGLLLEQVAGRVVDVVGDPSQAVLVPGDLMPRVIRPGFGTAVSITGLCLEVLGVVGVAGGVAGRIERLIRRTHGEFTGRVARHKDVAGI